MLFRSDNSESCSTVALQHHPTYILIDSPMDPSKVMYYDPRRYVKNFDPDMQSKAPRRGAVDLTAVNQVRTDHWHRGLPSQVVSRNHDQFPAITFCPSDGVGSGVALTECDFAQGIAAPAESIFTRLPASLQNITSGVFLITVCSRSFTRSCQPLISSPVARISTSQMEETSYVRASQWHSFHHSPNGIANCLPLALLLRRMSASPFQSSVHLTVVTLPGISEQLREYLWSRNTSRTKRHHL